MGNPYTSQSISGYNSSPPSDDGAETAANVIKWATHKNKLADPIKTLAEAINSQCASAFGKVFGNTISEHSSGYSIVAGDIGKVLVATASMTFTLPAAATAGDGFPIAIINGTTGDTVSVGGFSSETINGLTSFILPPGAAAIITSDGSEWWGYISARSGGFTGTLTGYASGPTGTVNWILQNGLVTMWCDDVIQGTSNAGTLTMTGLDTEVQPADDVHVPCVVRDNSANSLGSALIQTGTPGTIVFSIGSPLSSSGFTASNNKGLPLGWQITYRVF